MTAVEGTNYEAPSGTATIQPGSSTVDIAVTPILDATTATDTTLSVNLATGYYLVGSPDSVEVVIENLETPAGKNVWVASAAGNASDAANWSQGVPQAGDDILLDLFSTADMTWDLDATNGLSASVASWTQTSNYTGTVSFPINYTHVAGAIFTNFTVTGNVSVEGGTWTHPANASTEDYRLFVTVGGNLTVASGASITATGKGYYNAGKNNGCHGGNANGVTGSTYGDPKYPTAIGACNSTSAGGGAILLDVSGAVVLNGAVTAAGVTAHESYGGAGGSILIDAPSISGTGSINANGAMGTKGDWYGYAGSGGRIALLTDGALAFPTNKVTAYGRMTGSTGAGSGAGTIFLKKTGDAHGTLIVANSTTGQTAPSSNPCWCFC